MKKTSGDEIKPQRDWFRVILAGVTTVTAFSLVFLAVLTTQAPKGTAVSPLDLPIFPSSLGQAPTGLAPLAAVPYSVTYQLLGSGAALDVTYVSQGSDIEQQEQAPLPWSRDIRRMSSKVGPGYLTVSARNGDDGVLTCRITVNGVVAAERTAAGMGKVVRCAVTPG